MTWKIQGRDHMELYIRLEIEELLNWLLSK